jgi:hypothetical protein
VTVNSDPVDGIAAAMPSPGTAPEFGKGSCPREFWSSSSFTLVRRIGFALDSLASRIYHS